MKKCLILLIAAMSFFVGCSSDDDFTPPNYVTFDRTVANVAVILDGTESFDVTVYTANVVGSDRTFNINVASSSTIDEASYELPGSVTIPANTNEATFTIEFADENISNSGETLILSLDGGSGVFVGAPLRLNVVRDCPSDLTGDVTWTATSPHFEGTLSGTNAIVRVADTANRYRFQSGDFDFGYYCVVYEGADPGCGEGATGNLAIQDTCGELSFVGADDFGDSWHITNVGVDGADLTYTWTSDYGETSTVTLTRTDGEAWPNLQ